MAALGAMKRAMLAVPKTKVPAAASTAIRVCQFNILASNLGTPGHFPYCKASVLDWRKRRQVLLREMRDIEADVLCLEELSDYWTFFQHELRGEGYDSVYAARPSLHTSTWSGARKQDGCGIFFRRSRFKLLEQRVVNYADKHDRVALMALLHDSKGDGGIVLVANTHLYWDSKKVATQMSELRVFDAALTTMRTEAAQRFGVTHAGEIPLFVCGDFNNGPRSEVYEHMMRAFAGNGEGEGGGADNGKAGGLASAYGLYTSAGNQAVEEGGNMAEIKPSAAGEPPYTSLNFKRAWTIDYVFFDPACAAVTHLLEVPSEEELRREDGPPGWLDQARAQGYSLDPPSSSHAGIPNSRFGSDHLPIAAEFVYKAAPITKLQSHV